MALADLGVAIGPRNKRRLAGSTITVIAVAAVAAAGFLLLRPTQHTGPASSAGPTHAAAPTFVTDKLVYGITKAEVVRRVGNPTKTVGACWQYDENEKIRGGQNTLNAQRVCFLAGIYSYDYSEIDGKWFYPTTPLEVPSGLG